MLNKKSQLGEALLFFIAIASVGLTLYAFTSFSDSFSDETSINSDLISQLNFAEKYSQEQFKIISKQAIKNCFECSSEELAEKLKETSQERESLSRQENLGNFYGQLRNKQITISQNSQFSYNIEIQEPFIQIQIEENKIKRQIKLCQVFDTAGTFLNDCD